MESLVNEYIGEIGFTKIAESVEGYVVDLGYFMSEKYWNKGIMTEAVKALAKYAFTILNVAKIESSCYEENRASEMVMKNVGMIKEGHIRKHSEHNGQLKDRVVYGLLKSEWKMK